MDRKTSIFAALGIAGAVALGIGIGSTGAEREPAARSGAADVDANSLAMLEALRDDLAKLREDNRRSHSHAGIDGKLAGFERRLAALDSTLTAIQDSLENLPDEYAAEMPHVEPLPQPTPEEQAAALEERARMQLFALEDQLHQEGVDPSWAHETETHIHEAFRREELADMEVIEARCASTLCRLDLAFDETVAPEDSLQRLQHHRPWDGAAFVTMGADGQARIYLARTGHDLPEIDIESGLQ